MRINSKFETFKRCGAALLAFVLLMTVAACSRESKPSAVRAMPAGKEFSGFLSDYGKLKPNPEFERTLTYVSTDPNKNIHRYVAVIIEPVAVYVSTDADVKNLPDRGRTALADYFQQSITKAVGDAFPVVTEAGPLVLRLRSALIGVDVGPEAAKDPNAKADTLERSINIGKVGVEMEMVDSETGEQIAAAVDRQNLGDGATVGSAGFSREEKFRAATEALDGWAARLRAFLDSAHELSKEDIERAVQSYRPYGRDEDK